MDDLGRHYEDINVMTSVLDNATSQSTATAVSPEALDQLKRKIADEAGFELSQELNSAGVVKTAPVRLGPTQEAEAALPDRLKALRNPA